MWEEAPPPEAVQKFKAQDMPTAVDLENPTNGDKPAGPNRGRARAVDFM